MLIAITGSEGFIGKRVLKEVHRRGHGACHLDRCDPVRPIALENGGFTLEGASAVIHLAAHADVRNNWDNMAAIETDNISATLRVLEEARRCKTVRSFVFISTGAVYSKATGTAHEWAAQVQESPYAASKMAGEAYVQAYGAKCGWNWSVLRPAACVGPGYSHGHIADFVRQVRETGKIHALDSGEIPRPALHVDDLAEACVRLATESGPSGVYNIAGGWWSWRRTVEQMQDMACRAIEVTHEDRDRGWLGDNRGAAFCCDQLAVEHGFHPWRDVARGVRESLESLGWPVDLNRMSWPALMTMNEDL